jgi:hypothetical protein
LQSVSRKLYQYKQIFQSLIRKPKLIRVRHIIQIYAQYDGNPIVNSLITLVIGYTVYIPLFAFPFYRDNKAKYIDPFTGRKNSNKIKIDIKKLFTAFSISEAIFVVSKTNIHYSLLVSSVEPYQTYAVAEFISWVIYFISINVGTKAVKLFEN